MKITSRQFWLAAAAAALLLSVLVFLYGKAQHFDEADYLRDIGTLRHLKQLDTQWELDVLKSRHGVNPHYDALAGAVVELDRLVRALQTDLGGASHDDRDTLLERRRMLAEAVQEKLALVEQFKSRNSLLRNSLAFLHTAGTDVLRALDQTPRMPHSLSDRAAVAVNDLLYSSMLYSQEVSDQRASEILSALAALEETRLLLSPSVRPQLEVLGAHVRVIVREQKAVDALVGDIAGAPTGARIDAIYQTLIEEQQRSAKRSREYRNYLLMFSAALLALLLFAAVRLLRHAETHRANRELHRVNEQLEHRVQERTLELQNTQGELVATARRAGRAEIATNVLHNVGNILNSVNVSAALVTTTLRRSRAPALSRAIQMMDDHAGDLARFLSEDEKGRLLPAYLRSAAATVAQEQQSMRQELQHLTSSVDHIKDVVSTQQSYAGGSSVVEPALICQLVEDALRINAEALARHRIVVIREFFDVPVVRIDRARVLQILVNLISNAGNAMETCGESPRRIVLRISADDKRLRVSVHDNGVGIAAENLTRIFSHGFTTRASGHGFGLHSCALAASQTGGTLDVHSDGPGQGATFTLELPLDAVPVAARTATAASC